jgi:hypothetical protein
MNNSEEILNEIKSISPFLAGMAKVNVFRVPEGYFEDLQIRIAAFAILNNATVTDNMSKRNLQKVPEGYFDTLSDSILQKIKIAFPESAENELRKLSPALYSLKDINVFSVPQGYFASFPGKLAEKIHPGKPAKIVAFKRRSSWWKYAAAAIVTGLIAVSSFEIFKFGHNGANNDNGLTAVTETIKNSFQYKNETEVDAGIAKLSDADIVKYLEKNGNVMDNAMLLNNIDVSEMPDQTDYLQDANTLDNYLDKIGVKNN